MRACKSAAGARSLEPGAKFCMELKLIENYALLQSLRMIYVQIQLKSDSRAEQV